MAHVGAGEVVDRTARSAERRRNYAVGACCVRFGRLCQSWFLRFSLWYRLEQRLKDPICICCGLPLASVQQQRRCVRK